MLANGFRYAMDPTLTAPVNRVAARILDAARTSKYAERAQQVRWDVAVIDEPQVINAFAVPSGRVIVFSGLFPVAHTEAGLATVLGHEVAHVLANHSLQADKLHSDAQAATALAALLAEVATQLATNGKVSGHVGNAVKATGARLAVVAFELPYSRDQELEADRIGTELAARAGYDPREALAALERMQLSLGTQSSSRASTHPDIATRAARSSLLVVRCTASSITATPPARRMRCRVSNEAIPGQEPDDRAAA